MSSEPDNLDLALGGARGFLRGAEIALAHKDFCVACQAMDQVRAHLAWAEEIIATRTKRDATNTP